MSLPGGKPVIYKRLNTSFKELTSQAAELTSQVDGLQSLYLMKVIVPSKFRWDMKETREQGHFGGKLEMN